MRPPEITPVPEWPADVQQALMKLVEFAWNGKSVVLTFDMKDLRHEQLKLGDWEISIRRTD